METRFIIAFVLIALMAAFAVVGIKIFVSRRKKAKLLYRGRGAHNERSVPD